MGFLRNRSLCRRQGMLGMLSLILILHLLAFVKRARVRSEAAIALLLSTSPQLTVDYIHHKGVNTLGQGGRETKILQFYVLIKSSRFFDIIKHRRKEDELFYQTLFLIFIICRPPRFWKSPMPLY